MSGFGRRTYEMFESFWPNAIRDPRALKRAAGKNMLLLGSGQLTRLMTRDGLIDEYQFGVVPVILGKGQRLLDDLGGPRRLLLVESPSFPSGTVLLRYRTSSNAT